MPHNSNASRSLEELARQAPPVSGSLELPRPELTGVQVFGRLYFFTYSTATRGGQPLEPHFLRDGHPAAAISNVMREEGYVYAGFYPNYPSDAHDPTSSVPATDLLPPAGFGDVDGSGSEADDPPLDERDMLVITTLLPMDPPSKSRNAKPKLGPRSSDTTLEGWVFRAMRERVEYCSKKRVTLRGLDHRLASLEFNATHPCNIKGSRTRGSTCGVTAAYMIRLTPETPMADGRRGPKLLWVCGVCGTSTLVWAHWLARHRKDLLKQDGVVVAQISAPIDTTRYAPDHDFARFARKWKFDLHVFGASDFAH